MYIHYDLCEVTGFLTNERMIYTKASLKAALELEQLERRVLRIPPAASWLPIPNLLILKRALHATHLLKLLDKMCKYEMDPMSIVEDTERTRFCPQTDRRTDRRTDKRTDGQGDTSIPPINFVEAGGIIRKLTDPEVTFIMARGARLSLANLAWAYTESFFLCEDTLMHDNAVGFFHITGPLWGESTGHRWIPFTKGQLGRALLLPKMLAWTSCWPNCQIANDLKYHNALWHLAQFYNQ